MIKGYYTLFKESGKYRLINKKEIEKGKRERENKTNDSLFVVFFFFSSPLSFLIGYIYKKGYSFINSFISFLNSLILNDLLKIK